MGSRFRGNDEKMDPGSGAGMTDESEPPRWMVEFLSTLILTGSVREAVDEAKVDFEAVWQFRKTYPEFAIYWDRAVRLHRDIRVLNGSPPVPVERGPTVH